MLLLVVVTSLGEESGGVNGLHSLGDVPGGDEDGSESVSHDASHENAAGPLWFIIFEWKNVSGGVNGDDGGDEDDSESVSHDASIYCSSSSSHESAAAAAAPSSFIIFEWKNVCVVVGRRVGGVNGVYSNGKGLDGDESITSSSSST